ncbi:MAG: DNRLRE domain-containing protein, partial [Anaerolineae bacterium]|nr:DNRLRE domain-containing protein [Anaerolineae bacterium]
GAVYETDYPYVSGTTGITGTCSGSPHTKHEKLVSWHYVGGEYPSVAEIKQAISDHGPVYVSMCAGPGFEAYGGGIFNTDESGVCYGGTNHGVVLVGWDDSQGAWYLRNSWGTGWGETLAGGGGGYMRIAYGTSNVGRAAAYAVYPSPDVGITKDVVGSDFAPGDPVTFTLAIDNSGSAVAAGVVVTDVIPAEVLTPTFASTLAITPTGVVSYVWQVEPLSAGESGVITIYGWIDPSLPSDFAFVNSATISDPKEIVRSNNTSSVTVGKKDVYLPLVLRSWPPVVTDQFYAIADTCVLQGAPTSNFGGTSDMWAGYDHCSGGQIGRSLIEFDLSSIPSGATISEARLYVRLVNSCDIGERTHTATAYRVNSSWSSSSVTWNTQPGYAEAYGSASIPSRTWGWYSFDVTNLVRGWVNGSFADYGLMIRGPESSGSSSARLGFSTLNGSYDPYLEITYVGADIEADPSVTKETADVGECGSAVVDALESSIDLPCCGFEYKAGETGCPID